MNVGLVNAFAVKNGDMPLDIGHRWSSGELSDWEVLSLLTGESVQNLKCAFECMSDEEERVADSWRNAGEAFDNLLGGPLPYHVEKELYKL
jgi:hypothetical protein